MTDNGSEFVKAITAIDAAAQALAHTVAWLSARRDIAVREAAAVSADRQREVADLLDRLPGEFAAHMAGLGLGAIVADPVLARATARVHSARDDEAFITRWTARIDQLIP